LMTLTIAWQASSIESHYIGNWWRSTKAKPGHHRGT
jgi:hypothetical protein